MVFESVAKLFKNKNKKKHQKTIDKKISCIINKRNKLHKTNGNTRETSTILVQEFCRFIDQF